MSNNASILPDNIMELENDHFFKFVQIFSGEKLATLLEFQDITNAQCLLACDDPFEIISFDSDDLLDLKKKICIKLNNNSFAVLPGIASKMKILKAALLKKHNEIKKEAQKKSLNVVSIPDAPSTILSAQISTSSTDLSVPNSSSASSSLTTGLKTIHEYKEHIIYLLDNWCLKIRLEYHQPKFLLKESLDYEIIINLILKKAVIQCQCGSNTTLGQKDTNFIQCGSVALEIMQSQDISSVECLLENSNIFAFLEFDSDELIPLKRKAGILLNDGRFILKKGLVYKVETFLNTLHTLNQQYSTFSTHRNSNNSSDLIVPEYLLQKFPFIQTLITYSKLIVKSKYDFTFLNIILNNMIRNSITEERGFRYETIVRQFATSLYILGGRTAYEFVRLNIPAFLPSVQIIQSFIVASDNHLSEGLFNYDGVRNYFNSNQSTLGFIAEDATAVVPKVTYDTTSNSFVGFSLPLDKNGLPIAKSYATDSFTRFEQWYSNIPRAKLLNACLVQPLSSSLNNISPYLLTAYGTDNKFKSSDVISRWYHVHQECKAKGIRILGFSTDCDSRYLNAMRISLGFFANFAYDDHPDLFAVDLPSTWSWFFMQHEQLYICFQDAVHICTKLRNRLLSETAHLLLGDQLINIEPLLYIISNYSKLDHLLVVSDVNPKDRQNYSSAEKISSDKVSILLEKIPNSLGINIYLQAIRGVRLAYVEKNTNILDRIYHAWTSVFIFRLWCLWINAMDKQELDLIFSQVSRFDMIFIKEQCQTRRQYFITYQTHFSVEINAHCLVYLALLVSEGQLPHEALNIWLQNSQTCEGTFRSARAISSAFSGGVNFTVAQFLSRINKLSVLQNIKSNTSQNDLRFPQHHKLSRTSKNSSNSLNTTILSKKAIEDRVLDAYKYVTKLFDPLKIKQLLRNGRIISIEETSNIISRELEVFWSTELNVVNSLNVNSDIESDDETNCDAHDNVTNDYDSDEEFELNDNLDVTNNVSTSTNRGLRLFSDIKQELSHTFFKVSINNENKFLHKQAACWVLEKEKCSLSADRSSRVQGR
ncbi:unnamed protein product [Rotaria sp. Silwood2]|nr:unnamed protein product [Rotaria sp. Silwood2]CAF3092654.1 unnamed protein product [Rotaria sp. Silwood2]CAF3351312.1 unnamed protein product [Rotaria sp. Silwood2]CAF4257912.1 unnamed protein product [Rotaria sp. Silwood2]CAF4296914.1 unnamed protein product [Rotaria sp. Silwood2]